MDSAGFKTPVEDRYFEDYAPGSVHEFGMITIEEEGIIAFRNRSVQERYISWVGATL
jgi:hypothetical protein